MEGDSYQKGALTEINSSELFSGLLQEFYGNQDAFDHDRGQKSAISGHRLHWIFWNFLQWIISLFSRFSVQCSKEIAPKCGENCPISGRRKKRRIL